MTFGHRRRRAPFVAVVSMADVAFNLVLFFMLTTHLGRGPAVAVELPVVGTATPGVQPTVVTIALSADGGYSVDARPTTPEQLAEHLRARVQALRTPVVVVAADRTVEWQKVVYALDTARALGVRQIELAARERRP